MSRQQIIEYLKHLEKVFAMGGDFYAEGHISELLQRIESGWKQTGETTDASQGSEAWQ